ncbi:MAG: alkyl hydroperoxide reductase subunit F [Rikenellaceae bacterium]
MLDNTLKDQVRGVFSSLVSQYTLFVGDDKSTKADEMIDFLGDVADCSPNIILQKSEIEEVGFSILKDGKDYGIKFRAIPNGHEFTSLLLAILNLDGKGRNLPDDFTIQRIKKLQGSINLTTYVSLTCTNCPDVVQALNIMAICSNNIKHETVDGAIYKSEVDNLNIQSVPTVYADGELFHVGRGGIAELLTKLESKYGSEESHQKVIRRYDVAIAGGGAAGATAAIYLARKGLTIAVVAERIGGQVNETGAIENIPSISTIMGTKLAHNLKAQMLEYPTIDILENRTIEGAEFDDELKKLKVKGGEIIEAPQLIIATGAQWRKLGIRGESEYIGRGVAFCPHCDGPLFKGKNVAVIGGGNSGVEAAIDLSGICKKVTLLEFMPSLKADEVLQEKVRTLGNIEIMTNVQISQIIGDGTKVTAIELIYRTTEQMVEMAMDGIFIQIGLSANSLIFYDLVAVNHIGEIEVDRNGRTSTKGVYAAGDITDVSYKQIVISMGEGAKAALATFDDKIRNV